MYLLYHLRESGEIPFIPLVMDSPMASKVLALFDDYKDWHNIDQDEFDRISKSFQIVETIKDTWNVINNKTSKVIVAGSGMITGGRVLTYLQQFLDKPETSIVITGYQAEGTRGRALLEGTHELKIYGK